MRALPRMRSTYLHQCALNSKLPRRHRGWESGLRGLLGHFLWPYTSICQPLRPPHPVLLQVVSKTTQQRKATSYWQWFTDVIDSDSAESIPAVVVLSESDTSTSTSSCNTAKRKCNLKEQWKEAYLMWPHESELYDLHFVLWEVNIVKSVFYH